MTAFASCSDSSAKSTPIVGLRHPHDDEGEEADEREGDDAHRRDPRRPKPRQEIHRPVHLEGNLLSKRSRRGATRRLTRQEFPRSGLALG